MSNPIRSRIAIVGRAHKRPAQKEVLKAMEVIREVEFDFENALFSDLNPLSYRDLYDIYLLQWQEAIEKLVSGKPFKYIVINKYHFANQYKPLKYL